MFVEEWHPELLLCQALLSHGWPAKSAEGWGLICVWVCVCIFVCIFYLYLYLSVLLFVSVSLSVFVFVCICVCICICGGLQALLSEGCGGLLTDLCLYLYLGGLPSLLSLQRVAD